MQALWSRVGQAHSCGCKACGHAAGGLLRRSTTAAGRRKPTFGEVFTACYTSILGTAAVLDAKRKDERRKDLAAQLEEARAELERLRESNESRAAKLSADASLWGATIDDATASDAWGARQLARPNSEAIKLLEWDIYKSRARMQEALACLEADPALRHLPTALSAEDEQTKDIHRILGDYICDHKQAATLIWRLRGFRWRELHRIRSYYQRISKTDFNANLEARSKATALAINEAIDYQVPDEEEPLERLPRSHRQLRAAEAQVAELVDQLLAMVGYDDLSKPPPDSATCRDIHRLAATNARLPAFEPVAIENSTNPANPVAQSADLGELHASLRRAFADAPKLGLRDAVARICHNLLVSPHPPTAETYALLILGFGRVNRPNLSAAVVSSLQYRSKLYPTDRTILALLNHHARARDYGSFLHAVARMLGASVYGVGRRRRLADEVRASRHLQAWVAATGAREFKGYVVQPVRFGRRVLEQVLRGLVHFQCLTQAAEVVLHCVRFSVGVAAEEVHRLLGKFASTLDHEAAEMLLRGLVADWAKTCEFFKDYDWHRLADQLSAMVGLRPSWPSSRGKDDLLGAVILARLTDRLAESDGLAADDPARAAVRLSLEANASLAAGDRILATTHFRALKFSLPSVRHAMGVFRLETFPVEDLGAGLRLVREAKRFVGSWPERKEELERIRRTTRWSGPDEQGRWLAMAEYASPEGLGGWTATVTCRVSRGPEEKTAVRIPTKRQQGTGVQGSFAPPPAPGGRLGSVPPPGIALPAFELAQAPAAGW